MQLDLDKSTKDTLRRGSLVKSKNIILDKNIEIIQLEHKTYKYREIEEANDISHTINTEQIRKNSLVE